MSNEESEQKPKDELIDLPEKQIPDYAKIKGPIFLDGDFNDHYIKKKRPFGVPDEELKEPVPENSAPSEAPKEGDILGGPEPTEISDMFTRSQVREQIRKALDKGVEIGFDWTYPNYHSTGTPSLDYERSEKAKDDYLKQSGF